MSSLNDDLSRLLSLARSWIGRDLADEEILKLTKWLAGQRTASTTSSAEIDQGLAAASAVIAEGRQAAEAAMMQAFQSVRNAPQQQQPDPQPPLQDRVASAEQRVIEGILQPLAKPAGGPLEQLELSQLSQTLAEIVQIQVREQVGKSMAEAEAKLDLKLAEIDGKVELKLTEIANRATEIVNRLSADIREQLVRDLAEQTRKTTGQSRTQKKK
ncbi:hypothetical protein [uncultured Tateyamaria sp.]|uniref:hypothetical protein n=1 Tax=uncultured Tateyamaria sp. TaxID=455651 RepID=UPI00262B4860|nr:hypothetical protein [uncultured Tateyamaria sp.]